VRTNFVVRASTRRSVGRFHVFWSSAGASGPNLVRTLTAADHDLSPRAGTSLSTMSLTDCGCQALLLHGRPRLAAGTTTPSSPDGLTPTNAARTGHRRSSMCGPIRCRGERSRRRHGQTATRTGRRHRLQDVGLPALFSILQFELLDEPTRRSPNPGAGRHRSALRGPKPQRLTIKVSTSSRSTRSPSAATGTRADVRTPSAPVPSHLCQTWAVPQRPPMSISDGRPTTLSAVSTTVDRSVVLSYPL
jgi:hypothetical protein